VALAPGVRLLTYEIRALVGVGGMGEVYRARDTKLNRDVALKLLPASFGDDRERVARFEREAQLLAALNHPHIATIHGFDDTPAAGGGLTRFLVMELVEGDTLAERLTKGALPHSEALAMALQVTDALQAAHEKGIVHRDLKPANIKITPGGTVKVLDFGLAKAAAETVASASADLSHSPTMTAAGTLGGTLLGTAPYMSPEQARGLVVDKRTDIWAFGCVLFEALTGRRAFPGETITDTLAAIVHREPDWAALPGTVDPGVRRVLQRCLQKDQKRRLHDIADARVEIEDALAAPVASGVSSIALPAAASERSAMPRWLVAAGVGVAIIATFAAGYMTRRPAASSPSAFTFSILPPEGTSFLDVSSGGAPALSPDGRFIAFVAEGRAGRALWVRSLDKLDARPLPGTEGAVNPFWSPDGGRIGFIDTIQRRLKSVEVTGGQPAALGTIVFNATGNFLYRFAASGGADPVRITERNVAIQDENHLSPSFLPDGRHYLLQVRGGPELDLQVWVGDIGSNDRHLLLRRVTNAQYAPPRDERPGYIVYGRDRTLIAQPFDADRRRLVGDPITIAERLAVTATGALGDFSVSAGGALAYRTEDPGRKELEWLDRSGKQVSTLGDRPGNPRNNLVISPDGKSVAFTRQGEDAQDVWIHEFAREVTSRFTQGGGRSPVWSPDGDFIAFVRGDTIYRKRVAGDSAEIPLWKGDGLLALNDWSGDGRHILFTRWDTKTDRGLWLLPDPLSDSSNREATLLESPALHGQFGPRTGAPKWIAFDAEERPGVRQAYVRTMPGVPPGRWQISTDAGNGVRTRRDGREIFFTAGRELVVVEAELAPFRAGAPRALFPAPTSIRTAQSQYLTGYDVTADGTRFLATLPTSGTPSQAINVVLHWQSALPSDRSMSR
jgi:eukaryotic-like serine/threonine-protein kinase